MMDSIESRIESESTWGDSPHVLFPLGVDPPPVRENSDDASAAIRFEPLLPDVGIFLSRSCRFTTDSVLLARFADPRASDAVCDLCCGGGIVPLLWYGRGERRPRRAVGVDIDRDAIALFQQSLAKNALENTLQAMVGDLRDLSATGTDVFDLVTCNPPYDPPSPSAPPRRFPLATQEISCTLDDVCAAAARLLRIGGRLCVCYRPARLADLFGCLRAHGLEPKRLRLCAPRPAAAPTLVLMEAVRGARPGGLTIPAPLILADESGAPSAEYRQIYRMG